MNVIPAQDALASLDCVTPNCVNEADGEDGLCGNCRQAKEKRQKPSIFGSHIERRELLVELEKIPVAKPQYGLKCKTEGCENPVSSHKGLAGWCGVKHPGRKSHREVEIQRRRVADPHYGRPGRKGYTVAEIDAAVNTNGFWLTAVRSRIEAALREVEEAETNLDRSKENLRKTLREAQEEVK